ncbi:MAG: hypothetical protein ABJD07_04975 [Gemmatimonadaceae bacterium]
MARLLNPDRRIVINRWIAPLAVFLAAAPLAAQATSTPPDTTRRPMTVPAPRATPTQPTADPARAADAELRVALYELVANRPLAALARLERVQSSPSAAALRTRDDLLFLLSESYYRLGMSSAFRARSIELLGSATGARYGSVLRGQLMLDAYRGGDYPKALEYSAGVAGAGDSALTALVAGLARYQTRAFPAAHESFAAAARAGGAYGSYAQFMDVLATFAADTTQAAATLDKLRSIGGTAPGAFGDQVKLTAAEIAFNAGQFDAAIALTEQISTGSGFSAEALFTRAWSLYRAKRLEAAAGAFADYATRFPNLERRDEARLMAGQAMLESGRSADAAQQFRQAVAGMTAELAAAHTQASSAMMEAAKAIVGARAVGILALVNPATGKAIALPDNAGADYAVLLRAWSDSNAALPPSAAEPRLVSLGDVDAAVNAMGPSAPTGFSRRVLYAQASNTGAYADRSEAIVSADVRVGLAQLALSQQLDDNARRISQLQRLQSLFLADSSELASLQSRLAATQDSLAKVGSVLDQAKGRVHDLVKRSIDDTRQLALENQTQIEGARKSAAATAATNEGGLLAQEAETAALYRELSDIVESALDAVVARMPIYHLRDSVNAKNTRVSKLYNETRGIIVAASSSVNTELSALQGGDTPAIRAAKGLVAQMEVARGAAETQLIALIDAELRGRATRLVSLLERDTEAAEFGAASATFFRAVDSRSTGVAIPQATPPAAGGVVKPPQR